MHHLFCETMHWQFCIDESTVISDQTSFRKWMNKIGQTQAKLFAVFMHSCWVSNKKAPTRPTSKNCDVLTKFKN